MAKFCKFGPNHRHSKSIFVWQNSITFVHVNICDFCKNRFTRLYLIFIRFSIKQKYLLYWQTLTQLIVTRELNIVHKSFFFSKEIDGFENFYYMERVKLIVLVKPRSNSSVYKTNREQLFLNWLTDIQSKNVKNRYFTFLIFKNKNKHQWTFRWWRKNY